MFFRFVDVLSEFLFYRSSANGQLSDESSKDLRWRQTNWLIADARTSTRLLNVLCFTADMNVTCPITDWCCIQTIVVSDLKNETQTVSRVKTKTKTLTIQILSWDLCPDQHIDSRHFRGGDPLWRYAILELHSRNDDDPLPQPSKKIFGRTPGLHPRCLHSGLPSDNVAAGLREREGERVGS